MFTVYIHTLEVLAMHPEGATVKQIVSMGIEWSSNKIHATLQSLMDEGYVTCDDSGHVNIWQMTEKAAEYTGRIARLWDESQLMNDISDYARSAEKMPSNPFVGVIPGAWEELPLQMVVSGDYVFSVDENGVPDHAYVGLANEDGSLPFDAIESASGNVPLEGPKEGFSGPSEMDSDVTMLTQFFGPSEPIEGEPIEAYGNPEDWEFDTCIECGELNKDCGCYDLCEDCGHFLKECWC